MPWQSDTVCASLRGGSMVAVGLSGELRPPFMLDCMLAASFLVLLVAAALLLSGEDTAIGPISCPLSSLRHSRPVSPGAATVGAGLLRRWWLVCLPPCQLRPSASPSARLQTLAPSSRATP